VSVYWFGSGSPLWALSIEFHIYMLVGAIFFILKGARRWPILVLIAIYYFALPSQFFLGNSAFKPEAGDGLFGLWLSGFALAFTLGWERIKISAWLLLLISCAFFFCTVLK
jgi:peptidoglycan/LPS O-acetylase OafA/YrhL